MLSLTDLKVGTKFIIDGDVYSVLYNEHSKVARGGAMLRTKLKNLITGAVIEKTFKGSEKFERANLERKNCQFLYREGDNFFFMNNETYDQFSLDGEVLEDSTNYIKESDNIQLQYFGSKPISVELPPKVKLKVTKAAVGVKGNTASSSTKPVTVETGYSLQTPLFVKEGDTLLINTQTGEYVERV